MLPSREEARKLLEEHVKDEYQKLHVNMVANALEMYAHEYGEDPELWWTTGLLHDLDYFEFPDDHPMKSLEWFKEWQYPEELIHAVAAHNWKKSGIQPESKLAAALIATDELSGFLYAYSLMRPEKWEGMKPSSVNKKFKDRAFAAKIDREEVMFGVEKLGVDFSEHVAKLIEVFKKMF
jgi:putative nucleotidyltransferase with HDIG domain